MAISDRRKREKEHRRQSIIDAAEKLFFQKGYDNVSMNDIANEVELNRATLYLYFENKEAVCFAVILRGIRLLNKIVKDNVRKAVFGQRINAMGRAYYNFFQIYPQYFQVYTIFQSGRFDLSHLDDYEYSEFKNVSGDVREIIQLQKEIFDLLHLHIKDEIKRGKVLSDVPGVKRTGIRQDIDSFYATCLVLSTIESMLNPSPILKKELKDREINKYQFEALLMHFVTRLLVIKD